MKSFSDKLFIFVGIIIIAISGYACFRIPVSFGVSFAMAIIIIITGGIIVTSEIYPKNSMKNDETNETNDNANNTNKIIKEQLVQPEKDIRSFYDNDESIEEDLEDNSSLRENVMNSEALVATYMAMNNNMQMMNENAMRMHEEGIRLHEMGVEINEENFRIQEDMNHDMEINSDYSMDNDDGLMSMDAYGAGMHDFEGADLSSPMDDFGEFDSLDSFDNFGGFDSMNSFDDFNNF